MVVIQEPIQHYDVYGFKNGGENIISSAAVSGKSLQGSAVTSMMGLLVQLSDLSKIANNMYENILGESKQTFQRITSLSQRIEYAATNMSRHEQAVQSKLSVMLSNPGIQYNSSSAADQSICSKENFPPALAKQYNNCLPPPNLDSLDQHLEPIKVPEGDPDDPEVAVQKYLAARPRKCIHLYTDPQYFRLLWAFKEIRKQKMELLERKKEKEKRREERKQRKNQESTEKSAKVVPEMISHRMGLAKKVDDLGSPTPSSGDKQQQQQAQQQQQEVHIPPPSRPDPSTAPPPPPSHGTVSVSSSSPPPPPPPSHSTASTATPPPPPPSSTGTPPPPPPSSTPAPPPPPPSYGSPPPPPPSVSSPAPPPPPPSSNAPAPPPPPPAGSAAPPPPPPPPANAPAPPPPPPAGSAAPPPPPSAKAPAPPPPSGGGGGGPTSFLDQIRSRQFNLQKASEREVEEKAPPPSDSGGAFSVADILSRKFANVNVSDSEESDSDDEFDDDDW